MKSISRSFGEPQARLVVRREGSARSPPAVLVVPNNHAPILQSQFIHHSLYKADVVMDSIHEYLALLIEYTHALLQPSLAPRQTLGRVAPFLRYAKSGTNIVRWISNCQLGTSVRS